MFALDHRTPFDTSTSWKMLKDKSFTDRLAMLEDENVRSSLCDLDVEPQLNFDISYLLFDDAVDYRHEYENSLTAHAKRMGMSPVEAFIQLNRQYKGRVVIYHPGLNQSMEAIEEMLVNPTVAMGLADSGAHVGQIMDASSPTWLLSYWVRERGVLSVEEAIRGWTSDTANLFGVRERGVLKEGAYADVNVIDLDNLAIDLPEYKHDFPGGAGRYVQTGRGYEFVLVNGQVFMESGEHSGALSGQILRS